MTALLCAITALSACNIPFGADDDAINPQIVNTCDGPIGARLLRPDGGALRGHIVVPVGANPVVSAGLGAFDGVDSYIVEIDVEGSPVWKSDPIPLSDWHPTYRVTGSCTPVSTCVLSGVGEVTCSLGVEE